MNELIELIEEMNVERASLQSMLEIRCSTFGDRCLPLPIRVDRASICV
ncbi:MAG: hypothetical protein HYY23_20360 [Verrucomicrobia bacterium]|nr:hypothetical protein [Verrucomicrobiota bacterium]